MINKTHLTYEEQLALLKLRGVKGIDLRMTLDSNLIKSGQINSRRVFLRQLQAVSTLGYYQLKTYLIPYRTYIKTNKNSKILGNRYHNISFDQLVKRYYKDKKLRQCTLQIIEDIESTLNTKIAHVLGEKYGAWGYLDFNKWCQIGYNEFLYHGTKVNQKKLNEEKAKFFNLTMVRIRKSNNPDIVRFRKESSKVYPPIWLFVNELTFGNSIHMISLMNKHDRRKIAKYFHCSERQLLSWLMYLKLLRNICCHNGNLCDFKVRTSPIVPHEFQDNGLLGNLLYVTSIKNKRGQEIKKLYTNRFAIGCAVMMHLSKAVNAYYDFSNLKEAICNLIDKNISASYYGFRDDASVEIMLTSIVGEHNNFDHFTLY